jgi:hypothetical protein
VIVGLRLDDLLRMLYTGISPSRPPTNGKPPSTQRGTSPTVTLLIFIH